jgi:hypothetical protein
MDRNPNGLDRASIFATSNGVVVATCLSGQLLPQAARTEDRKEETFCFRLPLSAASDRAADKTCDEAAPVSDAPR